MKVQLYGGGIDSVCIDHLEKPDVKVFFNLGTVENRFEAPRAKAAGAILDNRLFLGDQVLPNKILPARNLLLVALASYYGNHIILGSTAGDTTKDKDQPFLDMAGNLLDHILGGDQDKSLPFHGAGIRVYAPAINMTKSVLVATYLANGGDPDTLLRSRSCYGDTAHECGTCRSCVRKYVALRLNGLTPVMLQKPDLATAYHYARIRQRGQETEDILQVLTLDGGEVAP